MKPNDTQSNRSSEWAGHLQQWQQSQLSGAAFCQQQGLTYHQFIYWKQKLLVPQAPRAQAERESPHALVKVAPLPNSGSDITLVLPTGLRIDGLNAGNIHLLGQVLAQL